MSASNLKIIALITMIIDHIGAVFYAEYLFLRIIGRIAFPIFAFFVAKGCEYSKNKKKYLLRLLIFALISEIPYDLCFNNYFNYSSINFLYDTNTIYTLLLGALIIFINKYSYNLKFNLYIKYFFSFITLIFIVSLSLLLNTDYSLWGILLILLFYYLSDNKYIMCIFAIIFIMFKYIPYFNFFMYLFNILPIFLIYFYNNEKGIKLKWIFYIAYPLHLTIIALLNFILVGNV